MDDDGEKGKGKRHKKKHHHHDRERSGSDEGERGVQVYGTKNDWDSPHDTNTANTFNT